MIESCTIILPLPSGLLSPNRPTGSIGGRIQKAKIVERYRLLAKKAVLAEGIETGPWQKSTVSAVFFHRDKRRRDGVNYNAMLKSAQDGIVDAGLVVDDDAGHLTTMPPEFKIDKECPRVEITVAQQAPHPAL